MDVLYQVYEVIKEEEGFVRQAWRIFRRCFGPNVWTISAEKSNIFTVQIVWTSVRLPSLDRICRFPVMILVLLFMSEFLTNNDVCPCDQLLDTVTLLRNSDDSGLILALASRLHGV